MQEQNISDLMVYKALKVTITGLLQGGKDPIEIAVSLNALCIDLVTNQLESR